MELKSLKPRIALNKAFLKIKPLRAEIELFKSNLIRMIDTINESESEEFHKNLVQDFLKNTWYQGQYFINTKGRNDLVVHNGAKADSTVGVIVEAKRPAKTAEMLRTNNINYKAFQELVYYYLRERITHKNTELKHLVATNIYEWYVFDAHLFEKLFAQNKTLVKQFIDFEEKRASGASTDYFYTQIAAPAIDAVKQEISFTYFDIRDYEKPLRNNNPKDDNLLIALYKLLSPQHLLKLPFANDSNSLDKAFYTELLHIIGLTEIKNGGKKLIQRKKEGERNSGSLLENTITQLDSHDKLSRIPRLTQYGSNYQEQLFGVALELVITWINRVLFLKLLEAQLTTYHKGDISYSFLNGEKIRDFDDLDKLFFRVLAKKPAERDEKVQQLFGQVPYLNSSLFEPTELEHQTLFVSGLEDFVELPLISSTVLKDATGKKISKPLNTLQYLFGFLDAYNFSSEGTEDIQEDNKRLINASVLGLIFEKINGYKDGSFFTPGFITMYMCRETIRRAVVQKFNETKGWECKEFDELYDKIDDRSEANTIINSLKICDPAVGSGHFLVSALNELIAIKSELRVLQDREGKRLKEYTVQVENDELVVTDDDGQLFEYNPLSKESQRVQETLFHEKQTIIENCLFGVDINPNSVKICRLRLWIELLKNAYYRSATSSEGVTSGHHFTNSRELETLPNIDINIKCGNSLISRYALDADIKKALKRSKWTIDSYRLAVMQYRNARSKNEKREMERLIGTIKNDFESEIASNDKRVLQLNMLRGELYTLSNQTSIFEKTKAEKAQFDKDVATITTKISKLENELEEIRNNKIYENAFEWRFEFPEVLNDEGDFLGFDVVIGNPPYGVSIKGKEREILLSDLGKVPDFEIYYWFIDKANKILKYSGQFSYIIPNTILFNLFAQNYRLSLFENWNIEEILDCTDFNIFADATVRNIVLMLKKESGGASINYRNTKNVSGFEELIRNPIIKVDKSVIEENNKNWGLIFKLDNRILDLVSKLKTDNILSCYFDISQGYIPYRTSDLIKVYGEEHGTRITKERLWHSGTKINDEYKQEIFGRDISKYGYKKTESYVWYGKHLACYVEPKFFNSRRILIREITNPTIIACLLEEEFVNDPQLISIINKNEVDFKLESLWAILNSKLATFYHFNSSPKATKGAFPKILVYDINNFPIPKNIDIELENQIVEKTNQILNFKHKNKSIDTTALESEIDQLVYELYGLTEEEIRIVEGEK